MNNHIVNQNDLSDKLDNVSRYGRSNCFDMLGHKHGHQYDVASQHRAHNNMKLLQKKTMNHHNKEINILQRNLYMAQYRFRMMQKYQAMRRQYNSKVTSMMTEFQTSQDFMTQEQHQDIDDDITIDRFHEQERITNNTFHHHVVSSSSLLPNDGDDVTCIDNEALVSHHSSFESDDDEPFDESAWHF